MEDAKPRPSVQCSPIPGEMGALVWGRGRTGEGGPKYLDEMPVQAGMFVTMLLAPSLPKSQHSGGKTASSGDSQGRSWSSSLGWPFGIAVGEE